MSDDKKTQPRELDRALAKLRGAVLDGLDHGFFNYSIKCELVQKCKRRLTIEAGKSHQFTISEEELKS